MPTASTTKLDSSCNNLSSSECLLSISKQTYVTILIDEYTVAGDLSDYFMLLSVYDIVRLVLESKK